MSHASARSTAGGKPTYNNDEDIAITVTPAGGLSPTGHLTCTSSTPSRGFNENLIHMQNNNKKTLTSPEFVRIRKGSKWNIYTTKVQIRRKHLVAILALVILLLYVNYNINGDDRHEAKVHVAHVPGIKNYLVWSDRCKIPNIDPYLPEVMQHFKRQKPKPCSHKPPLTRITFNASTQLYTLQVNQYWIRYYTDSGLTDCCYQRILRNANGTHADKDVKFGKCVRFKGSVVLPTIVVNIIVRCFRKRKQVYLHGHAMMPARTDIQERLAHWREMTKASTVKRPPSVLLIGIDSISHNNLIRAMPKTAKYLYDNEWFEMSGYNKIGDNTFPNLMAILTGLNHTTVRQKCPPTRTNGLAQCPFIWDLFRRYGYVTAYAEDEPSINTFNYNLVGFEHTPVDYYLRPFLLAAEKSMHIQSKSGLSYCLGLLHSADFVYDYALELATRFHDEPFFGLFWTNTFSHNDISDPSSMDERMLNYLKRFNAVGTLNNTVVMFFSDHGIRFGPTRKTISGHLEERLPFMFLWLPPTLKTAHPEYVNALRENQNRLTNPYDVHMTLKILLLLSGRANRSEQLDQAPSGCPRCQTLLKPVPHNRSCSEIAIADHWCTCTPYRKVDKRSMRVQLVAQRIVEHINDFVTNYHNGSVADKCAQLNFSHVENAYQPLTFASDDAQASAASANEQETYRILLYTKPNNGLFEATVLYTEATGALVLSGEISRLDMYSSDSRCMNEGPVKKFCSCLWF